MLLLFVPICSGYHSVVLFSLMVKTLHKVKYSWECAVPPNFHWNQQMCRVRVSGACMSRESSTVANVATIGDHDAISFGCHVS